MTVYAMLLFLTAGGIGWVARAIGKGNIRLIHDYHQSRVADPVGYGNAFAKSLRCLALSFAAGGGIGLLGNLGLSLAVLALGLVGSIAGLIRVQKRYNGGIF